MKAVAKATQITNAEPSAVAKTEADYGSPLDIALRALRQGVTAEQLGALMDVQERYEANQARKAYVAAMAEFKKDPPTIIKNKRVSYTTSKGTTAYDHATLDQVCSAIIEGLSAHGISHRWDTHQDGGKIKVTCILTHVGGHSEHTALESTADDSGGKNSIQAIGSAVTYLQRYTLLAATGLAVKGADDDGRGAVNGECINAKQIADLEALISEVAADQGKFLRLIKVDALEDILACNYAIVVGLLEQKRR